MPERIQVSSNVELKDKIIDHGVDLLNMEQLSNSQRRELDRFINNNAHLLNISDKEREERERKEKKQNRYAGPGTGRINMSSSASDYGTGRKPVLDSLNRISSPSSEYGTGKRKEVSWSDGVRARSHSPTNDGSGFRNGPYNRGNRDSGYGSGYGDPYGDNMSNIYSSLDRSSRGGSRSRDKSSSKERRGPNWEKPWIGNYGSKEDVSSSGKPWHSYIKERENSPAYSTLSRHPDDYNRYETRKYIVKELEKTKRDESARFYGFGDRVGSGIELTPKRWTGGELINDPNFIKKSLKPRRLFYSPIGDGVVEADGIELKRGPKDMTPRRYVTHEKYEEKGDGGHGGVNIYETRWADGDGNNKEKNDDGYGGSPYNNKFGSPFDDGKNKGDGNKLGNLGDGGPKGDSGDDWPRSGRSSALSIGTDGFPRQGWTKTFITNPRELIHQYGNETLTTIFDLEDHTPKTITTTKEIITNNEVEGPLV